jgi:hypothetical protein
MKPKRKKTPKTFRELELILHKHTKRHHTTREVTGADLDEWAKRLPDGVQVDVTSFDVDWDQGIE